MTLTENDNTLPFPCPTCRRLCGSTVSSLPDDFKSKLLVDTVRRRERERRPEAPKPPSEGQLVLCQVHGNRRCEFFCEECTIPVCVKCVSMEHGTHCYIDVFEDSQFLITEMEEVVEAAKRDIQKLEENNTDIDIMLSEFNFNLEERSKKLKKLVEQTASQIKQNYSQDLLGIQGDIRRQVLMHHNFMNKTNEFLTSLKASLKDCAVFDVYADAKLHLGSSSLETPQYLLERPAKFEFSQCVEFQISSTLVQFFGYKMTTSEPSPNLIAQLGLQTSPNVAGSTAQAQQIVSCPLGHRRCTCVPLGTQLIRELDAMSPPPSLLPQSSSSSSGAKRPRQYHVASNIRRPNPSVEALFSSVARNNAASSSYCHTPEPQSVPEPSESSESPAMSLLRSLLPVVPSNDEVSSNIAVSHPLTPFVMSSLRQDNSTLSSSAEPLFISRPRSASGASVDDAASGHSSRSEVMVPLIDSLGLGTQRTAEQRVMQPYDVQQFFQSFRNSEESRLSLSNETLVSSTSEFTANDVQAHSSSAAGGELVNLFPELSVTSFTDESGIIRGSTISNDEDQTERVASPVDIAEETL